MIEKSPGSEQQWLNAERATIVSNREFFNVFISLSIPETYFQAGQKVLSVGEGLSNFARKVRDEFGASVTAVDPIYSLGKEILTLDKETIKRRLAEYYGNSVKYIDYRPVLADWPADEQTPDSTQLVAGSVYELPFKDKSFDIIVSNRLMEHIDLNRAISEFSRTVKESGEIRFSDCLVTAIPDQGILLPGSAEKRQASDDIMVQPSLGFYDAMLWLAEHTGASVYFQLNGQSRYAQIDERFRAFYNAGVMIIRFDSEEPTTRPFSRQLLERLETQGAFDQLHYTDFPHLGEVYQVDMQNVNDGEQKYILPITKLDRAGIVEEGEL